MNTVPSNSKVEAIRESVRDSIATLHMLINGTLHRLDASRLYQSPAENEWTIMQNLAHIVEFMPYWAGEVEKVVAAPGCIFGRTHENAGRLQGITEHEMDSLSKIEATVTQSYASLDQVLRKLQDSDLEIIGKHVRYGEKSIGWLIDDLIVDHLHGHVEQIKSSLELVG
jgi:uncharacterized damage-inducible protein DinB